MKKGCFFMMQSEQEGQRNLQQSGAAGQRNTQHATNIKKRSMRRKKARRMRRIKRIFVAAIILLVVFAAGRTSFVQGFLNHWNVKSEATLTAEGYPDSLIQLYEKNEEARQFVLDYKKNGNNEQPIDISSDVTDGKIPLFLQWTSVGAIEPMEIISLQLQDAVPRHCPWSMWD